MYNIRKYIPFLKKKQKTGVKSKRFTGATVDRVTIAIMSIALISLLALIYFQVRPLHLVDIKVPVATHKAFYYPGEQVDGIFFGEIFYTGRVEVYTDIFCSGYRAPIRGDDGKIVFSGNSRPVVLKGETRRIGTIPKDAPIGSNCVIQFVNNYDINTPFGTRHEERAYYTQNFFIRDPNDPDETNEIERTETQVNMGPSAESPLFEETQPSQPADDEQQTQKQQTERESQTPQQPPQNTNNTPSSPAEPVAPPQNCLIEVLGVKLICD